jgi:hypothetical protein
LASCPSHSLKTALQLPMASHYKVENREWQS